MIVLYWMPLGKMVRYGDINFFGAILLFTIIVIVPTILCMRKVKNPKYKNTKIVLGIAGFLFSYVAVLGMYLMQGLLADTPDTKQCPYCGGKILDTVKKCKHCGEWLDGR